MELREAFEESTRLGNDSAEDLKIVWVMSDAQMNERTRVFVDELGLNEQILFLSDPKSQLIRDLGILKENPENIEKGVPHPTTLLLDEAGIIRFVDVREDFHFWLDPSAVKAALSKLDSRPNSPDGG